MIHFIDPSLFKSGVIGISIGDLMILSAGFMYNQPIPQNIQIILGSAELFGGFLN
jgi:hypothetical protein